MCSMAVPPSYRDPDPAAYDVRPRLESEQEYFTEIALQESRRWIEAVTQKQFRHPGDSRRSLQDGILLCELLMKLKPGCIRKVNRLPTPIAGLDNLTLFQNCCRQEFGLQDCQLFDIRDLDDLRLRVIVESDEAEEELRAETYKRLRKVVITIFWLGKLTRGKFQGPALDFTAFSNLVDVPMTPLSRSEYSSPSGSTAFLPQEPPESSEDGFFRHRGYVTSPGVPEWNQQVASAANYDSLNRGVGYSQPARVDTADMSSAPVRTLDSSPAKVQRPGTLNYPNHHATAPCPPAPQRQISAPVVSPGFYSGITIGPAAPTPVTADPLRYVKVDRSPLADEAKQTLDDLERRKQRSKQRDTEEGTDSSWEANLSSWKSRRTSQRKSGEADAEVTIQQKPLQDQRQLTTTSSQDRGTQQLSSEIEDMVLSAFGFTRASQQATSPVVRSSDLVPATRPTYRLQQEQPQLAANRPPAHTAAANRAADVQVSKASVQVVPESPASITKLKQSAPSDVTASRRQQPEVRQVSAGTVSQRVATGNAETAMPLSGDVRPPAPSGEQVPLRTGNTPTQQQWNELDFDDLIVMMEMRPEHEKGLDFTLDGGRDRGPIIVTSVRPGGPTQHCGLRPGDELVAVNGAPLSDHYLESVVAVIDQVIHQGPLEFAVRRWQAPATQQPQSPTQEKTPPPLPNAPPPPLPAAQPPQFPTDQAFTVEGGDDWNFIDDEFSRDLDNILEEDPESGAETGYVSGDAGYSKGVGYSSDDDVSMRAASLRKRNEFLGLSPDVSEEYRVIVEDGEQKNSDVKIASDTDMKRKDERAFAVISTPRSSAPVSRHQSDSATDAVLTSHAQRTDAGEPKPSVKVEPTNIYARHGESSTTSGQGYSQSQGHSLPVVTVAVKADQERDVLKAETKVVDASKPEKATSTAAPVSRTDPAHLHKLVSQRIEQSYSSRREESVSSSSSVHEVTKKEYSKVRAPVNSTVISATKSGAQSAPTEDAQPRSRLRSEPVESASAEDSQLRDAVEKTRADVRQVREAWLRTCDSEKTETQTMDSSQVLGRLEKPKMWRSVEHLRSSSLSCAPEDPSITECVSRDMETTLQYQPLSTDSPPAHLAFNLDQERKRMAEWAAEQERLRKERFEYEQEQMRVKRELDLEKAKKAEEEKRKEDKELVAREKARQKEAEELARKRQDELKAKLEKAGVMPLEIERTMDVQSDRNCSRTPVTDVVKTVPKIKVLSHIDEQEDRSLTNDNKSSVRHNVRVATMPNSDVSTPDGDFVTAEVLFSEVRPQTSQFEMIPSDSDDPTSSGSGTPVPHRLRFVRDDVHGSGTGSSPGARPGSRSPLNVVEVCDVKSSEASQWRKEAMQASKPRPSGWLWTESQQSSETTSSGSERHTRTSSPGLSDDPDHIECTRIQGVQPRLAQSPDGLAKVSSSKPEVVRVTSPELAGEQSRTEGAVYRSTNKLELAPQSPRRQTSPRISPISPDSQRVLTPPMDMPFISDRTFPLPVTNDSASRQPMTVAASADNGTAGPSGIGSSPRPPPPPRTVSAKPSEVIKSSQTSDSYEMVRSFTRSSSSSSESSKISQSRSYEFSEKLETSRSYQGFAQEDSAKTRAAPIQMASFPVKVQQGYVQQSEHPVSNPPRIDEIQTQPGSAVLDDVGQSKTKVDSQTPGAVDMLFSYHQMTQDTGDGQFSTSSFNSRCSPAVMVPSPQTTGSGTAPVHHTYHYV